MRCGCGRRPYAPPRSAWTPPWRILRAEGLRATGELGDYRPLVALEEAAAAFHPDRIVISTHPEGRSAWLREGVVDKATGAHDVPVRHIVSRVETVGVP